ncbi:hypothetical protein ZYGR_0W00440 [Zygosaccharomyces rouxii]|uniref:ZYRO0F17182p n=2 Tax=Zygosaccharomyces rouxii TaxID=4956 RepID=C5DZ05_ZYGRC|nr:uncharacterized protein ZYRO0F17182g [Zygosaccharomyces rouxii]KAH9201272.1 transcription factor TOS4 and transcription factor PLM2 [Zygosaccharomyces rouxii]CAQ43358.1 Transcription factor TOS4 and Transcription factor PLM2 [Zygosaccharomyces rouxii]CAR29016.1 ZYRO0F17182p [Zygosaccharomyces rouxii]GAV48540.1 hypothetical protein ZYGR_0K00450 [Zygosaccharomyces rouxii]GAV50518.1 hypothetical protein ZYGR_0W00440 [Zygosaccharomyces rouxii]
MAGPFPPSSPVASGAFESDPFEYEDNGFISKDWKGHSAELQQRGGWYPTPDPSSSIGRSSSPIRAAITHGSSPERQESTKHLHKAQAKPKSKPIAIELDALDPSRLAVGRKHSVCDIVLPSKKSISRQHAFISYMAHKNQVKLECNGSNGCIVTLPSQLECQLVKLDAEKSVFELRAKELDDKESTEHQHDKELVSDHLLTSFVLLKGETVTMPFVKGTILDFRQAEAVLSMKPFDPLEHNDDEDNVTETEDEMVAVMTKSDDFHRMESTSTKFASVQHSPATPRIEKAKPATQPNLQSPLVQNKIDPTPNSHIPELETPLTPTKPKKLDLHLDTQRQVQETPLANRTNQAPPLRRDRETAFGKEPEPPKSKPKHNKKSDDSQQHKRKQQKSSPAPSTPEALIESLEQRGINCLALQHVLANNLAFASVLQTPLYQLQDVNSTISTLSREELRALLAKEHCIGVIHRQGKDAAGKPLDEEYFYDVENDSDLERRNLVFAFKGGRSGLRSCRKVHKQYFWKKPSK